MRGIAAVLVLLALAASSLAPAALAQARADVAAAEPDDPGSLMIAAFAAPVEYSKPALEALARRGDRDAVAVLILALRYRGPDADILEALGRLTGQTITDWNDAMLWQEAHPEVIPHPVYRTLKLEMYGRIDRNFMRFVGGERSDRDKMRIRLEEIAWGGVRVDGIPSLDNPALIAAAEATYLGDDNLVFGISINGDARAYPLRIMGWHEMFNEVIGGVPVALAYCTLCGAGILYETDVAGRDKPFVFGSSGFLYRSNKLMFDRQTDSLWNQFTGEPVTGPLAFSGIKLKQRPVVITSWGKWRAGHPDTRVLSLETGHRRDYGEGAVYQDYFGSPELMFPAIVGDESVVKRKGYVFGIVDVGAVKAWPIDAFAGGKVINDAIGARKLVLIGDAATRTVAAYDRGEREFSKGDSALSLAGADGEWKITDDALIGPNGQALERVAGHVSYWFAWNNYYGVKSELYGQ